MQWYRLSWAERSWYLHVLVDDNLVETLHRWSPNKVVTEKPESTSTLRRDEPFSTSSKFCTAHQVLYMRGRCPLTPNGLACM